MSAFFPSAFYFLYFGALSFLMPFLALYYREIGFGGAEIGLLTGIAPLITLVGGPFWTGLADSTRRHKAIMALTISAAIGLTLWIGASSSFSLIFGLVVLFSFFAAPIVSLADSATMSMLGEQKHRYGQIRLWGSVGWGLVAVLAGSIIEQFGLGWPFYGYAIGMGLALLSGLALHFPKQNHRVSVVAGMRTLFSSPQWIFFLAMVLLSGLGMASINSYLFVYMESMGMSRTLMGLALTVSTLSEIPVMFFASRFLRRFDPRSLLLLALTVIGFRVLAYSISTQAWQVLLIQLAHGLTFPIIWVAGVSYADRVAPEGLSATAQGMFGSTLMGVGAALGGLLGGLLLQYMPPSGMYLAIGTTLLVGGLFFSLAYRKLGRQESGLS